MHPVSQLQEYCQARHWPTPEYTFEEHHLPYIIKLPQCFSCSVYVPELGVFNTTADPHTESTPSFFPSKRAAKDAAAALACKVMFSDKYSDAKPCDCTTLPDLLHESNIRQGTAKGSSYLQALNMLCNFFSWPPAQIKCHNAESRSSRAHEPRFYAKLILGHQGEFVYNSFNHYSNKRAAREEIARTATMGLLQRVKCRCGRIPMTDAQVTSMAKTPSDFIAGLRLLRSNLEQSDTASPIAQPFNSLDSLVMNSPQVIADHSAAIPTSPPSVPSTSGSSTSTYDDKGVQFYYRDIPQGIQCKAVIGGYEIAQVHAPTLADAMTLAAKKTREKSMTSYLESDGWKMWSPPRN